jgi:hypothetical protein
VAWKKARLAIGDVERAGVTRERAQNVIDGADRSESAPGSGSPRTRGGGSDNNNEAGLRSRASSRPDGYCGAPSTTKVRNFATFSRIGRSSLNAAELRYAWYFSRLSHC